MGLFEELSVKRSHISVLLSRADYGSSERNNHETSIAEFDHLLLELDRRISSLQQDISEHEIALTPSSYEPEGADKLELRRIEAEEAQSQRDHEIQMALIQKETARDQLEASRLAAETARSAQEQTGNSLDKLIDGLSGDGQSKN